MLIGEHAVVHGHPAIVAAIDQRVTVALTPLDAPVLRIRSEIAPPEEVALEAVAPVGPYRFVKAAVLRLPPPPGSGLALEITSRIDPTLGLGSSAAVTVASLGALAGRAAPDLHRDALEIIRAIQGRGSGADLAASLHGGALRYRMSGEGPAEIAPLPAPSLPLALRYVGYKTPTGDVLARVAEARAADPARIDRIYEEMGRVSATAIARAGTADWAGLGPAFAAYQALMAELGVSDAALDRAVAEAQGAEGLIGAKISGSGLGDCAVALGAVPEGYAQVELAGQGVVIHDHS